MYVQLCHLSLPDLAAADPKLTHLRQFVQNLVRRDGSYEVKVLITCAANEIFRATELLHAIGAMCGNNIWDPLDSHVLVKPSAGVPEVTHVVGASLWFEDNKVRSQCLFALTL